MMQDRARTWYLGGDPMQRCRERQLPLNGPDGSLLSLDFTSGVLDSRITFTRSSVATYIDKYGMVVDAAVNEPRFTYASPGNPRGLLIEQASTNVLNWSETFAGIGGSNNNWADSNITRSTGSYSPDGISRAIVFTATASDATVISTTQTGKPNATRVCSVWLRRVNGSGNIQTTFAALPAWTTIVITSEWTRYSFQTNSTEQTIGFRIQNSGDAIEIWGVQLETGTLPTSYIRTAGSRVTREIDTAIIGGTNFSNWYKGGTAGTFVTAWCRCNATTTQRTVIATSDVLNQHLHQYIAATTSRLRLADKVPTFIETANASLDNSVNKGAFAYNGSSQSICLNGGTVVTGTLAFTTAPTWLSIGGPSTNGTSITDTAVLLNNAIRSIKYFPTRLSDADIKTITTL